jgi:hypothetical protein
MRVTPSLPQRGRQPKGRYPLDPRRYERFLVTSSPAMAKPRRRTTPKGIRNVTDPLWIRSGPAPATDSWIRPDPSSGQRFQTSIVIMFFPWYTISLAVKTSTTKSGLSTDLKYCSNIGFQYFFFVGISSWIFPFALIST